MAVWLNLTPDHLDRYPNMAEYRAAKLRIFENQQIERFCSDELLLTICRVLLRGKYRFSAYSKGADLTLQGETIHFRGEPILKMKETHVCRNS